MILGSMLIGCPPDNTPLLEENDRLQKQAAKQEAMIATLQEGNRVLQQQIDLLNQELRESKLEHNQQQQEALQKDKSLVADHEKLRVKLTTLQKDNAKLTTDNAKLAADAQWLRTQRTQFRNALSAEIQKATTKTLPNPMDAVTQATTQALSANGYPILASMATDVKAVMITERKISPPPRLELQGFRNQYVVVMEKQSDDVTKISVRADFEKVAQQGNMLKATDEEVREIESRLIGEISQTLTGSGVHPAAP